MKETPEFAGGDRKALPIDKLCLNVKSAHYLHEFNHAAEIAMFKAIASSNASKVANSWDVTSKET